MTAPCEHLQAAADTWESGVVAPIARVNQLINRRSQNDSANGNAQHDHHDDLHLSSLSGAPHSEYEQIEAIE